MVKRTLMGLNHFQLVGWSEVLIICFNELTCIGWLCDDLDYDGHRLGDNPDCDSHRL